jgi:hypothetical protein
MGFVRAACLSLVLPLAGFAGNLVWPTPNPAFQEGAPLEAFIQPTVSGKIESGLFGCVRNDGRRFHEGLDLRSLKRDRRGEALDEVYAVLPGRVAYVNRTAGHSSYGRYVVVVHDGERPAFHTLYAHLASIGDGIEAGARVEGGAVLGVMGRSAAGYTIPRARAHLHFEIGFRLTPDFQAWYDRQQFGSRNRHGSWNGMNLVSVDPLDFYRAMRRGEADGFKDWLDRRRIVARIRVHGPAVPGFVRDYPALLEVPLEDGRAPVAWDIGFSAYGAPLRWRARYAGEGLGGREGDVRILAWDRAALEGQTCRRVLDPGGAGPSLSPTTRATLEKLFGMR